MSIEKGSCQCGQVTYQITAEPFLKTACYCRDCQKASGGGHTNTVVVHKDSFALEGEVKAWAKNCANGSTTECYFCPHCSNRIYHVNEETPDIFRVKAGTLDSTEAYIPQVHLWVMRKQPWIQLPENAVVFDTQPDSPEQLFAALEAQSS